MPRVLGMKFAQMSEGKLIFFRYFCQGGGAVDVRFTHEWFHPEDEKPPEDKLPPYSNMISYFRFVNPDGKTTKWLPDMTSLFADDVAQLHDVATPREMYEVMYNKHIGLSSELYEDDEDDDEEEYY